MAAHWAAWITHVGQNAQFDPNSMIIKVILPQTDTKIKPNAEISKRQSYRKNSLFFVKEFLFYLFPIHTAVEFGNFCTFVSCSRVGIMV